MHILPIAQQMTFKNGKYIRDVKNQSYALKEFVEHPDLVELGGKSQKVIEDLMYRTTQIVNISCIDAIATLNMIKNKHPHLEKLANECVDLLEYYDTCKTW